VAWVRWALVDTLFECAMMVRLMNEGYLLYERCDNYEV